MTEKMSLSNLQGKLSRTEMKQIMAGSGTNCSIAGCCSITNCNGTCSASGTTCTCSGSGGNVVTKHC